MRTTVEPEEEIMLLVRNRQDGPTVFTDPVSKIEIEWAAFGDQNGEDVQQVPDDIATNNVQFARAVRRGVFEVTEADNEEILALLDRQGESWRKRTEDAAKAALASIDENADNDMVTVPCIGPNNRDNGLCGEPVPVREKTKDEHAALCSKHSGLRGEYIQTQTDKIVDGKAQVVWQRMTKTQPERQQAPTA